MEHSLKKQCTWLKPTQADGQTHTQEHTHKHPWRLAAKKKALVLCQPKDTWLK